MSKKDKLLEQLKGGKLTQSGGAAASDALTGFVSYSGSAPTTTVANFQDLYNLASYGSTNIAPLNNKITGLQNSFAPSFATYLRSYSTGNSGRTTFIKPGSSTASSALALYIADQITAGMSSVPGVVGSAGPTGATGANGANGTNGATGAVGATGGTGAVGATGANGTNGATGAVGATGGTGATGTFDETTLNGDWVIKSINAFYANSSAAAPPPPGPTGATGTTGGTAATGGTAGGGIGDNLIGGSFLSAYFNQLTVSTDNMVTINGNQYQNRLLTLADFVGGTNGSFNTKALDLAAAFDTLPLAQFKHLPALAALEPVSGGKRKQSRRKTSDKISLKRK